MSTSLSRTIPFELRRSPIQGTGAFATRRIRAGQKIVEYTGAHVSHEEGDARYEDGSMKRHHTFLFILDDDTVVDGRDGGSEASYINHSCDPNCEAVIEKGHINIYALKPIQPGQELAYDYQYEWQSDYDESDIEFYACRCGTKKCRGTILKVPKAVRDKFAKKAAALARGASSGAKQAKKSKATSVKKAAKKSVKSGKKAVKTTPAKNARNGAKNGAKKSPAKAVKKGAKKSPAKSVKATKATKATKTTKTTSKKSGSKTTRATGSRR